jgi:hypothetical protein
MATATARELRERIAHYKGLQRMAIDQRVLGAIAKLITEAEEHIRQLEMDRELKPVSSGSPF